MQRMNAEHHAEQLFAGKCLDTMGQPVPGTIGATSCHGYGGNQVMALLVFRFRLCINVSECGFSNFG